jgi:hypothetical protein
LSPDPSSLAIGLTLEAERWDDSKTSMGTKDDPKAAPESLPDWERLLAAERHLQHLLPGTVMVGGTAALTHESRNHDRARASSIPGK